MNQVIFPLFGPTALLALLLAAVSGPATPAAAGQSTPPTPAPATRGPFAALIEQHVALPPTGPTALLLAQLTDEGKVGCDEVAFSFQGPAVTYRRLAAPTSGLPQSAPPAGDDFTAGFRPFLASCPLPRTPGRQLWYATVGYSALGLRRAEQGGARLFATVLTDRILTPQHSSLLAGLAQPPPANPTSAK